MVRGEVFRLKSPRDARGHEQIWRRYGVIVQADELLALSTVILSPTSTKARPATFRPEIEIDGQSTRVLTDQTRAVDLSLLEKSVGRLDAHEAVQVDEALRLMLGL